MEEIATKRHVLRSCYKTRSFGRLLFIVSTALSMFIWYCRILAILPVAVKDIMLEDEDRVEENCNHTEYPARKDR